VTEADAWIEYSREAGDEYIRASERLMGVWISDHVMSEGVREAIEWMRRAKLRFEARLIALNAFMEART